MERIKPFILEPVLMEKIWGGRRLETLLGKKLPPGKYGESWEVSTHRNGINRIATGDFKGTYLDRLIASDPEKLLGEGILSKGIRDLPILVKFIDATNMLSVQVHPDDEYAMFHENDRGKTEAWYILHADEDAQLIYGLKEGTTREKLRKSIEEGRMEEHLRYVSIERGDVLFVPAGTVHAILGGVVLLEVQESSDSTYRLYDWNRVGFNGKPRPLHIEKALDVIDYDFHNEVCKPSRIKKHYGYFSTLVSCPYFTINRYEFDRDISINSSGENHFEAVTVIDGSCEVPFEDGYLELKRGDSLYIPPDCVDLTITPRGDSELIEIFVD